MVNYHLLCLVYETAWVVSYMINVRINNCFFLRYTTTPQQLKQPS